MPRNTFKKHCPGCNRMKRFHDSGEALQKGWTKRDEQGLLMPAWINVANNVVATQGGRWFCPSCSKNTVCVIKAQAAC